MKRNKYINYIDMYLCMYVTKVRILHFLRMLRFDISESIVKSIDKYQLILYELSLAYVVIQMDSKLRAANIFAPKE